MSAPVVSPMLDLWIDPATDRNVLALYQQRINLDIDAGRSTRALSYMSGALLDIAQQGYVQDPVEWAARYLTVLGEVAAALPGEGVPCVF